MSHFSQVKTKIKNEDILKRTLKKLGHTVVEATQNATVEVRGYFGATQDADFKILTSTHYDIGFKKGFDGTFELVGDWEILPKVSGLQEDIFLKQVKKEYAHQMILNVAEKMGYTVDYQKTANEDGDIQVSVKQWS